MDFDAKIFGQRVKNLRHNRGMTQEQLCAAISMSVSHLSKIEVGISIPSLDLVLTLSTFFDVSTDFLLSGRGQDVRTLEELALILSDELKEFALRKSNYFR